MDTQSLDRLERLRHGSSSDPQLLDFSVPSNAEVPPGVAGVYESALAAARRYPSDDYAEYRTAAAEFVGADPHQVVPAPGPESGLRLVFGSLLDPGDSALVPAPSCGEFAKEAEIQGARPQFVEYDKLLWADPADHALVVVCNPNNPTGETYPVDELRGFAERCRDADTPLVVNEEFLAFSDQPSFAGVPGVVVIRGPTATFGLPGLRAGYLVATDDLLARLEAARPAWTLSTPAALVGEHCLRQREWVRESRERVADERARMRERLSARFDVRPSDAPFLLLDPGRESAADVIDEARAEGVLVRDTEDFSHMEDHVRVTVRRERANDVLFDALGV